MTWKPSTCHCNQITPTTRQVSFAVYAPPGIGKQTVYQHLQDIQANVLLAVPEDKVQLLKVYGAG